MTELAIQTAIVELDRATLRFDDEGVYRQARLALHVAPGERVLVQTASPACTEVLGKLICGSVLPEQGASQFLGVEWSKAGADRVHTLRSMIGRVLLGTNWLAHLSVLENVILARQHHQTSATQQWVQKAVRLAQAFGLPGLPTDAAQQVGDDDLRRAACVRAFLGQARLIVLEEPTASADDPLAVPIINQAHLAADRGAAIVWLSHNPDTPTDCRMQSFRHYLFDGSRILEAPHEP